MRLVTWNVNGLRACLGKGFLDFFQRVDADVVCLQETKLQPDQIALELPGYRLFWNSAEKKGYSGTAVFTRVEPLSVTCGIGLDAHDHEGRVITAEFDGFFLVCCYTPNAQNELARIDYRMQWEDDFRAYLMELDKKKPVVLCGDLNVAHEEIDLKNPKSNRGSAGFSDQERGKMTELLSSGFTDTFRALYPDRTGAYTWWSYRFNARKNNAGWRIDYFIVSDRLLPRVRDNIIHAEVEGSDHCPVELVLDLSSKTEPPPARAGGGLFSYRPSLLQPQQHLPRRPGKKPRPGQGLLKGVAVGAHLHQQRTVGELLVVPGGAHGHGPGQGGIEGVHALLDAAGQGQVLHPVGVFSPLAGAQHQHDLGGVHPVDPGDGLVYRAVLPHQGVPVDVQHDFDGGILLQIPLYRLGGAVIGPVVLGVVV